jgi:hypothetical protein
MAPQSASELKVFETAKRGAQALGLVSLAVVSAPVVIIACPLLGAYEFATAYDAELYSGSKFIDGVIGGLFGVVTSPLAPFYIAWGVIEELYKEPPPKPLSLTNGFQERAYRDIGLDCLNYYNIAVVGVTGTGKVDIILFYILSSIHQPSPKFLLLKYSSHYSLVSVFMLFHILTRTYYSLLSLMDF